MESMDNKPSPPTTEDTHDVPRTARKRKLTLRARDNAKKGNQGTPWTTTVPATHAEPPSDDDDDDTLIKEWKDADPIDAPSTHLLEPQSSLPHVIARSKDSHHRQRRNLFERALDAGLALCAISTLLALALVLDAYEYSILPGASKPGLVSDALARMPAAAAPPAMTPTNTSAAKMSDMDDTSFQHEMKHEQQTVEDRYHELHSLSVDEIHVRAQSKGVNDPSHEEAFPAKTQQQQQPQKQQQQDVLVEKKQVIAQTVEKETGIDLFCPECTWQQTSITCAARLKFIQDVYHNDHDDVVKKTLLDQGCRRNDDSTEKETVEDAALQKVNDASILEAKEQVMEQIVQKEMGIDLLFCPECKWQTTSITCAARFKFIQDVYHNDEDDVVKKSLLDQGCKRENGARKRLLRG
jgi:hypothetical protein